jgi:hypothetical protein
VEISPEKKFGTTAFLGKISVRCKIFVGKIFLQHVKNCKYLCCEICYENEKIIEQNITKFAGKSNEHF